jgi:hypothetical protein
MTVRKILAEIRELEKTMTEPEADCDALRAKKTELLKEMSAAMKGVQVTHTPVVDERLVAYCDSLLVEFEGKEPEDPMYISCVQDIRNSAGTVYQQAIHDKLVKLYGPIFGVERVSETYRKVTAGV